MNISPKTVAKNKRYEVIKEMYLAGEPIYDIAEAVEYQPDTVEQALREMGFAIESRRPIKAVEREPKITRIEVVGKTYWDVTDLFIGS